MKPDANVQRILEDATHGRPITKAEAVQLLHLPENSLEASLLRSTANVVSRRRFANSGLLLGQIGVNMAPCGETAPFVSLPSHTHRFNPRFYRLKRSSLARTVRPRRRSRCLSDDHAPLWLRVVSRPVRGIAPTDSCATGNLGQRRRYHNSPTARAPHRRCDWSISRLPSS